MKGPRIGITPAVADCRYRAPLSPRLHGVYSIAVFKTVVNTGSGKKFTKIKLSLLEKYNIICVAQRTKDSFDRSADTIL